MKLIKYLTSLLLLLPLLGCAQPNTNNTTYIVSKKSEMKIPPYLKAGDTVAIIAPSGILKAHKKPIIDSAIAHIKSWGLEVEMGKYVYAQNGHFAGTDTQRAEDLQWAMDAPHIKAIWCARGGYGTVRVLDRVDYSKMEANPKWLIGYSDITALHNQLNNLKIASIHAVMCTSWAGKIEKINASIESFKTTIFGGELAYKTPANNNNKEGNTTGQLVGGNLTLIHTMLASNSSIDTKGKILFIEEIGEYAYHIDRMLWSLKRAGYFEDLKGIVVGDISKVKKNTTPFGQTIEEIILSIAADYDFPVLFDFPAGHEDDNRALWLGKEIQMKVKKEGGKLRFM
ncbi:MAG: LD-carboxypeptidase [Flavobacteriaceae bacterium]|nr:LD-carboxypeptidase [Flavobacteriaceae bacterium]